MKHPFWITALAAALLVVCDVSQAQESRGVVPAGRHRLKLATIVPSGSSLHKVLADMGSEWGKEGVSLQIFAGGSRGGEAEIVKHMRAGSVHVALLTAVGLSEIDPSVQALQSVPMLFRSLDEVDYVGEHLRSTIAQRLRQKGFVVLFWGDIGWVRFFSKEPIVTPEDLRRAKLFTWAGDPDVVGLYRANGFRPVPLETNDILPSLQSGMINAIPLPPAMALAMQVHVHAPYMLQLDWAPLVGAMVVTEKSWNTLPAEVQRTLARSAATTGQAMKQRNRQESEAAVALMQKRGLKVTPMSPQLEAEWRAAAERNYSRIRGRTIPADIYDEVIRLLEEYRKKERHQVAVAQR